VVLAPRMAAVALAHAVVLDGGPTSFYWTVDTADRLPVLVNCEPWKAILNLNQSHWCRQQHGTGTCAASSSNNYF